ncbi:hypothetical protein H4R33_003253 [Dimargaris cristalligena]|uniref:Armadillo-type protein n=1 Tax=Dimargaris cristalligena TaxID=215637 RepID=A0A4Q0A0B3_9FUNG|nr:hypothetical protein H4R33_003253 [Dimargaris cristalligena]RKP39516.1 armadillo-type protein [Dimargaris cristalligena]|eukprot:RKP39516.1 armadillo-type protein [Dimargaris cristalligena]
MWAPEPQSLADLVQMLANSISSNNDIQATNAQKLEELNRVPDYNNYLIYVLTQLPQESAETRAVAGLLLKNNVRLHFPEITPPVLEYIKVHCLEALGDSDAMVRGTVGTLITTIVSRGGIAAWPQVLPRLMELLDHSNYNVVEGAFGALQKICEDSAAELDNEVDGTQPLEFMIPKFIQYTDSPQPKLRVLALSCINQFILGRPNALMVHIDAFMQALFKRASDDRPEVRKNVCQAMVMLLESRPDKILPELSNIVDYIIFCTDSDDESLALEACEFWLTFAEQSDISGHLRPYLQKIIPSLLKGMVYSEMDLLTLDVDEDDAVVPDRDEDIKPRHHHSKAHESSRGEGAEPQAAGSDDDSDDDDDDDDMDDMYAEWNLRKCSAASLDVMASVFGTDILEHILPLLQQALFDSDWMRKECGILALGAIADGAMAGIESYLPELVPILLEHLNHPKALVRSISCWTLSRYSAWCCHTVDEAAKAKYFIPMLDGLSRMILDNNKRVQEAACSAFATIEEEAGAELAPYLDPIIQCLVQAFTKYQKKNLLILYDAVGTLADSVGEALNRPEYIQMLMPPLINKWHQLGDEDRNLFPLLECLSSVTAAVGLGFQPYAPPVFERCVNIVTNSITIIQQGNLDPTLEQEQKDFIVVALDLLSGMVQGLGASSEALIASSHPPFMQIVMACLNDSLPEVRQSTYALLGDLAMSTFTHVRPHLEQIFPGLIAQIDPRSEEISVCNNAAWSAGEISLKYGAEMQPWINPLLERLIPLLNNPKTARTLAENAAITIGRLGLVCPALVAPHLESFAKRFCTLLGQIRDNDEKDSAFRGLCTLIEANPNGILPSFVYFCDAVARWQTPSAPLNEMMGKILHGVKQMSGENWAGYLNSFPENIRTVLVERYGI